MIFTVDFETQAIRRRPHYPPEPVGVAFAPRRGRPAYIAWGHPTGNDQNGLQRALLRLEGETEWLCHNGSFDVMVAAERMGIPMPTRVDDTLWLLFLLDPYTSHKLKPSAERYLGLPPTEQDAVRDWLIEHKVVTKGDKNWGAHIADVHGCVVRPYAIGDVERTRQLFDLLRPRIEELGMGPAYETMVSLQPALLDNEQRGVGVDRCKLEHDVPIYEHELQRVEGQIFKLLGGSFNIDSGDELADRLEASGYVLPLTPTGKRSTAKGALEDAIPNGKLKGWMLYRSSLAYSLQNFMRPWAEMMKGSNESVIHVQWRQTKGDGFGAKTGRLSSSPNFQNLSGREKRADLLAHLKSMGIKPTLPEIRSYVIAPKGFTLFGRDYAQQELRILAHLEDSVLQQAYNDDPALDIHTFVQGLMKDKTGRDYPRKLVKGVDFGVVYGLGGPGLSRQFNIPLDEAYEILAAHRASLPSVAELGAEIRAIGDRGDCIRTLGGRRYFAETQKEGRSVSYRLLNYACQGGAADQLKAAMVLWWNEIKGTDTRFLISLHDELLGMTPTKNLRRATKLLNECMVGAFELDVPVMTTGERGNDWGSMVKDD